MSLCMKGKQKKNAFAANFTPCKLYMQPRALIYVVLYRITYVCAALALSKYTVLYLHPATYVRRLKNLGQYIFFHVPLIWRHYRHPRAPFSLGDA